METARLEALLERLQTTKSIDELQVWAHELRDYFGVTHVVYHTVTHKGEQVGAFTYSFDWARRYVERDYTSIDPVVRAAMRGDSYLYPSAVTSLVRDYVEQGGEGEFDVLTPRELEVLKLIAEAYTSKQIADELYISIKTVDRHRQNILEKLGMRDRVELTRYAIKRGLIQP